MAQLLSAGFARLFKNKLFWFGNAFLSGFFMFVVILNYRNMKVYPDSYFYTGSTLMFAPLQVIGIFVSCFTGMFLGTEYRDGTLRNKLIVGRSRAQVYFSNLIVCFAASVFVGTVSILATYITGVIFFGAATLPIVQMLKIYGLGILMLAALTGLFTLIPMLVPSKSAGSVINILFVFALLIAGFYVLNRLDAPPTTAPGYTLTVNGELQPLDPVPNPLYLEGFQRKVYEFFRDLLPTSQGSVLMSQQMERPLYMALCSLGLVICTTVSGIFHFNRKDLK